MTEKGVIEALEAKGPLTGAQLVECTRTEVLALWHACRKSPAVRFEHVGSRFLRLDRVVPGYARLSPSIRREFLTYTLLGLESQSAPMAARAAALRREIKEISEAKRELARASVESAVQTLDDARPVLEKACFIVAGDITYGMSHMVPRPEKSTGEMVRGSDLDIVIVTEDDLPPEHFKALDRAIYRKKHFLLTHPEYREEIDYLIKGIAKVREQLRFDAFEHMVASKILDEGELLYGSDAVFHRVKELVAEHGIPGKLRELADQAAESRRQAEARLLDVGTDLPQSEAEHLFYTREEGEEIF